MQYILWALAKLAGALAVLFLWYWLIRYKLVPVFREKSRPPRVPFFSTAALVLLSVAAILFAQAEFAYREVVGTPNRAVERKRNAQLEREAQTPLSEVVPDDSESLADRTRRMKEQAARENEEAKNAFLRRNQKDPR
jgi:hypothetical protein